MAQYKYVRLPDGRRIKFSSRATREQMRDYIVSNFGEQALRPAPTVMTDTQRQQARELAKQYEQPKSFGDKVSEWAVTSPVGRSLGLGIQGVANSYLNPAGYVARGMGMNTRPLEPQNTAERVIEAGTGALYDTAMFMPVGKAIGGSKLVGDLANSSNKAVSLAGKGIKALATPAAPAYELAGGLGGASLPAAVNLQAPSEDASFGDKAKYYAGNTALALLGGLGGVGLVGGGRALAKQGLKKYGVNADGSLNMELPKETVKPKSSAELLAEEGLKPVEVAKDVAETPVAPMTQTPVESGELTYLNEDNFHKNQNLNFMKMSEEDFRAMKPRQIHQSKDYGKKKGSSYYIGEKDGKKYYIRKSDHWGDFQTHIYPDDIEEVTKLKSGAKGYESADWQDGGNQIGYKNHTWELEGGKKEGRKVEKSFLKYLQENNPERYDKIMNEYGGRYEPRYPNTRQIGYVEMPQTPISEVLPQTPMSELIPETPLNPEKGISRLTSKERLAQNPNLSAEAKANLKDSATYDILHNQDLTKQAIADVNANPDMVRNSLLEKDFYTAQDFEDARLLASKLFSEGKTDDALTLIRTVSEKGSKAGQAVQSMALWSQMTPEGAVRNAQRNIDNYNALNPDKPIEFKPEQVEKIRSLQEKAMSYPDGSREKDVYTALSLKAQEEMIPTTLGDKTRAWQNISMLLNPKTFLRNLGGNAGFGAIDKGPTSELANLIDLGLSKVTGERTRARPQYGEYFKGFGRGAKYGLEDVNMGINTRKLGGKFDTGPRQAFNGKITGGLEKALGMSLQVPDRAFYEATYAESLANQMKAKGVTKATKEMENIAEQEALEAVFQNNGFLSKAVGEARGGLNRLSKEGLGMVGIRSSKGALGLGDLFMPYAQTPANITQQGINYSPLGVIKGLGNLAKGNQRQASLDLARGVVGTGMGYGGYKLAKEGLLTGDLNSENLSTKDNMERRRNLELMGIRPNQIWLGDKGYSYAQAQPFSPIVSAGAKFAEGGSPLDATLSGFSTVVDLPMLDTAESFVRDTVYNGVGTASKNFVSKIPARFIPTLSSQTADMIDDTVKETYDPNTFKQGINVALNKIPFARDVLPDRIDVTGQPMDKYSSEGLGKLFDAYVNPTFVNERKDMPIAQELERLYQTTGESRHFLPLADRKIRQDGEQRVLKPNEYVDYQRDSGQTNTLVIGDLMKAPYYDKLTDTQKVDIIAYAQKETNKNIKEGLFEGKDLIKEVLDKVEKRVESTMLKPIKKVISINAQKHANEVINKNHR